MDDQFRGRLLKLVVNLTLTVDSDLFTMKYDDLNKLLKDSLDAIVKLNDEINKHEKCGCHKPRKLSRDELKELIRKAHNEDDEDFLNQEAVKRAEQQMDDRAEGCNYSDD